MGSLAGEGPTGPARPVLCHRCASALLPALGQVAGSGEGTVPNWLRAGLHQSHPRHRHADAQARGPSHRRPHRVQFEHRVAPQTRCTSQSATSPTSLGRAFPSRQVWMAWTSSICRTTSSYCASAREARHGASAPPMLTSPPTPTTLTQRRVMELRLHRCSPCHLRRHGEHGHIWHYVASATSSVSGVIVSLHRYLYKTPTSLRGLTGRGRLGYNCRYACCGARVPPENACAGVGGGCTCVSIFC